MERTKNHLMELDKLENYLKENGFKYHRIDVTDPHKGERHQLIVMHYGKTWWDAICQPASYGWEDGLLEVMGKPVVRKDDGDSVCGFLTADEVIERFEEYIKDIEIRKENG